jgi:4-hydroxy-2-oxoheptanedioate aldolase
MNKVRKCWKDGRAAVAGWLQLSGTLHAEALSRLDYDAVVVDLQHSLTDFASVVPMLSAIENGGAEPFVRLQVNDPADTMKLLDAGAYGVIAPMINCADDAKQFAKALHYPPRGERSYGPRRPSLRYGSTYVREASETFVAFAMIETRRALQNIDEILAVDGIDGVFIGPTDLALDLGYGPTVDGDQPELVSSIAAIREKAHAAHRRAGIFCGSGDYARKKMSEGFDFVTAAPDLTLLVGAARAVIAQARS